jgi:hypothetical protein
MLLAPAYREDQQSCALAVSDWIIQGLVLEAQRCRLKR